MTQTETIDTFKNGIGIGVYNRETLDSISGEEAISVHGLLIPENTPVMGGQDVQHFYPPELAERSAEILDEQIREDIVHVVKNFHELEGQAQADDIVGKVTGATYSRGQGVLWQGEITDDELANKIDRGYLEVSPSVFRSLGAMDDQMQARAVNDVAGFRDVAIVGRGQDGVDVNVGTNPAIDALSRNAMAGLESDESAESDTDTQPETMSQNELLAKVADEYDVGVGEVESALETLGESEPEADSNVVTVVTE